MDYTLETAMIDAEYLMSEIPFTEPYGYKYRVLSKLKRLIRDLYNEELDDSQFNELEKLEDMIRYIDRYK